MTMRSLHEALARWAAASPNRIAVRDPGVASLTYAELDRATDEMRDELRRLGLRPGDRVGLCLRKSVDAVVAIFGAQKAGGVHVPVDASAPAARNAFIFENCGVRVLLGERAPLDAIATEWGDRMPGVQSIALDFTGEPLPLLRALETRRDEAEALSAEPSVCPSPSDLAYILYTSGSTGQPKGVAITHENAACFVDWCSETFQPNGEDVFSSHAPFHFDLSVLDLYLPMKHGATLVLVSEEAGKDPLTLAALIAEERITSWYSAPSILSLLAQFGRLERFDYSALRFVHFAGEVFPVRHLRSLKAQIPHPRYFNLYGPTETNVCTFHEIPAVIPEDRSEPYPIGVCCAHYRHRVVDIAGQPVPRGEEGELWIAGPGVMAGYWKAPDRDAEVFRSDPEGERWYRTGDVVVEEPDGTLLFRGRRDRMVKRRGYRVELGEIETALYRHGELKEAAVLADADAQGDVRIRCFVTLRAGRPSVIRMKQFCAEHLVSYMIPDAFTFLDELPRTSTGKVDYQRLKELP